MPKNVECPMKTCIWRKGKFCGYPQVVCFKWRAAADMGSGNIILMECLMFDDERKFTEGAE